MPGYLRLPVLLPDGISGFPSVRRANALGIARGYPAPLMDLAPLQPFHVGAASAFPGAERLVQELVTLPTHSLMREGIESGLSGSWGVTESRVC